MKIINLLFVFFFIGLSPAIFSQEYAVDKKATWVSLTGSYTSSGGALYEDSYHNKTTTTSLSASFSHFVARNFFIGGGLSASNQSTGSKVQSFGIGPFIGYAFGNSESTAIPYIDLGLSYHNISSLSGSIDSDLTGRDIFSDLGVIFSIKEHLGLTFEVGYHSMKMKAKDSSSQKSGNIISLSVGFAGLIF